jgi:hypothetical protein
MIIGAHSIVYSTNPDADRAFLDGVLKLPSVDVGGGWLIFGLPPAELAVHPSHKNDVHEFYLMCDDVKAFIAEMARRDVVCEPAQDMGWGVLTQVRLPGGGKLGVYQPRHARPPSVVVRKAAVKKAAEAKPARSAARRKAPPPKTRKKAARRR